MTKEKATNMESELIKLSYFIFPAFHMDFNGNGGPSEPSRHS
jgi:hypothetical protein